MGVCEPKCLLFFCCSNVRQHGLVTITSQQEAATEISTLNFPVLHYSTVLGGEHELCFMPDLQLSSSVLIPTTGTSLEKNRIS